MQMKDQADGEESIKCSECIMVMPGTFAEYKHFCTLICK